MATKRRLNHRATIRAAVWDACEGKCVHCGADLHPFRDFDVDHAVALAAGGKDDPSNLVGSCRSCNRRKGSGEVRKRARATGTRTAAIMGAAELDMQRHDVDGDTLNRLRRERMMTTRDLARIAGTSHDAIIDLERNRRRPRGALLRKLATALDVEPRVLLRGGDGRDTD